MLEDMQIRFAKRMDSFQSSIFTVLNERKRRLQEKGRRIYDLSIGTPDFRPSPHVMEALIESARKPENYKYSIVERPELLDAVRSFYQRRFQVELSRSEVMALNGSQEGMALQLSKMDGTYSHIAEATGASTATISRVNRSLLYGADGYRRALDRVKAQEKADTTEEKREE